MARKQGNTNTCTHTHTFTHTHTHKHLHTHTHTQTFTHTRTHSTQRGDKTRQDYFIVRSPAHNSRVNIHTVSVITESTQRGEKQKGGGGGRKEMPASANGANERVICCLAVKRYPVPYPILESPKTTRSSNEARVTGTGKRHAVAISQPTPFKRNPLKSPLTWQSGDRSRANFLN